MVRPGGEKATSLTAVGIRNVFGRPWARGVQEDGTVLPPRGKPLPVGKASLTSKALLAEATELAKLRRQVVGAETHSRKSALLVEGLDLLASPGIPDVKPFHPRRDETLPIRTEG